MREFRQRLGRGQERYWMIDLRKDTVITSWGAVVDGKHREHGNTEDKVQPKGKENTKAFMSAKENAVFTHDRAIRKKMEEGYVELGLDGKPLLGGAADEILHDQRLPKNLCFSKPKNSVADSVVAKLDSEKRSIYTRKVNGMMVVAHIMTDGTPCIYSRRMDPVTDKFPHLVRALKELGIPPRSILLFEAWRGEGNTKKDMALIQEIMNSDSDLAISKQIETGWAHFYLFRVPILDGEHLESKYTNGVNILTIENAFTDRFLEYEDHEAGKFLSALEVYGGVDDKEAMRFASEHDFEGWVVYDKDASLGDKSFCFTGKPDRPSCCFKRKKSEEDDFIAYFYPERGTKERPMGSYGTGKNRTRVGTLSLYQLNSAGVEVYICEVGSGFSDEQRSEWALRGKWPKVVQVEFEERFYKSAGDKTNALQLPRLSQVREDKGPGECINLEL
jgi:ATP-dependent DNA ligase